MKKIMVIEHDTVLHLMYSKLLSQYKAEVVFCSNIAEAAQYISQNHLDLIISDFQLPDASSLVLLKLNQVWKNSIPTILVTTDSSVKEENPYLSTTAHNLLFKPIQKSEFHSQVSHLLSA